MPLELGRWKKLESGAWGVEWTNGMKAQDVVIKEIGRASCRERV